MLQDQYVSSAGSGVDALFRPNPASATCTSSHWQTWSLLSAPAWQQVGEDGFVPDLPSEGRLLVPLRLWRARRHELLESSRPVGLLIHESDDPAIVSSDLDALSLIVVSFTTSQLRAGIARSLRGRHGYAGLLAPLDAPRDATAALHVEGFNALGSRVPCTGRLKHEEQIALARLRR